MLVGLKLLYSRVILRERAGLGGMNGRGFTIFATKHISLDSLIYELNGVVGSDDAPNVSNLSSVIAGDGPKSARVFCGTIRFINHGCAQIANAKYVYFGQIDLLLLLAIWLVNIDLLDSESYEYRITRSLCVREPPWERSQRPTRVPILGSPWEISHRPSPLCPPWYTGSGHFNTPPSIPLHDHRIRQTADSSQLFLVLSQFGSIYHGFMLTLPDPDAKQVQYWRDLTGADIFRQQEYLSSFPPSMHALRIDLSPAPPGIVCTTDTFQHSLHHLPGDELLLGQIFDTLSFKLMSLSYVMPWEMTPSSSRYSRLVSLEISVDNKLYTMLEEFLWCLDRALETIASWSSPDKSLTDSLLVLSTNIDARCIDVLSKFLVFGSMRPCIAPSYYNLGTYLGGELFVLINSSLPMVQLVLDVHIVTTMLCDLISDPCVIACIHPTCFVHCGIYDIETVRSGPPT
ncbi:hypothetical protein EV421DRAFT_1900893 [Armillaria borealis]|uniref:SET domain-containing protein n=1 Tax=Armillaria borealis TaxID=47425 RepID=A0AA39JS65_9AGAR|nr:hypothetical protein EV421DRAFT_1900893 [Armillaria borealis]